MRKSVQTNTSEREGEWKGEKTWNEYRWEKWIRQKILVVHIGEEEDDDEEITTIFFSIILLLFAWCVRSNWNIFNFLVNSRAQEQKKMK